ncbi:type II toxin-antitoxin system RelE/ParE family toxin [Asticcacaulis sp. EMRT-3]|uniref:type II toxin-antitoxin system RelE/ParE family toxin n=1 Tax=Asticcacaulis sp. EMRT-3 TaxID=3040349 RepID=UPI0024AF1145|nr:type II toxin-antitoxin system RelE/ParE family toxin [Asticcacaulis sp. EMRT-3]MDI7776505.1 type II toxin-antitoxin system RelE/ParE family toxin [Asticcacaulis sp. EMRT-3]
MSKTFDGYRFRPAAEADLELIWLYGYQLWSAAQADRYIINLYAILDDLVALRIKGRDAAGFPGYLKYPVGSHMIYFKPSGFIDIVRILHQSMDVEKHLPE